MKRNAYYPVRQADQITWLVNFANKLPGLTAALGLTAPQVTAAVADCGWLAYVLQTWLPAVRTWAQASTEAATEAQTGTGTAALALPLWTAPALPTGVVAVNPGALTRIFALVQAIKDSGQCTDALATNLGLLGTAQTAPDPATMQPAISAALVSGNTYRLTWPSGRMRNGSDVTITVDGVLAAETYRYVLCRLGNGLLGVLVKDEEHVFYDRDAPFMKPVYAAISSGEMTKEWLGTGYEVDARGQQWVRQEVRESEGLQLSERKVHVYEYCDGKFKNKYEKDQAHKTLFQEKSRLPNKEVMIFLGIILTLLKGYPIAVDMLWKFFKRDQQNPPVPPRYTPPDAGALIATIKGVLGQLREYYRGVDVFSVDQIARQLPGIPDNAVDAFGVPMKIRQNQTFVKGPSLLVLEHVVALLLDGLRRGRTVQEIVDENCSEFYRVWVREVLGRANPALAQEELSRTLGIEDLLLWFILSYNSGAFDDASPSMKSYLFYKIRREMRRPREDGEPGFNVYRYVFGDRPAANQASVMALVGATDGQLDDPQSPILTFGFALCNQLILSQSAFIKNAVVPRGMNDY
ncbi:MAG: hypothetical protein WCG06_05750, partial [Candidatus Omnitrophota bacterium]